MVSLGVLLLILGIGSFVLPLLGLQFRVLSVFGPNQDIAAIAIAVVGAILVAFGLSRGRQRATETAATTTSAAATGPAAPTATPARATEVDEPGSRPVGVAPATPTPTPGQEWSTTRGTTPTAATSATGGGTAPGDPQAPPEPAPAPSRAPGAGLESASEPPVMGTMLPPSSSHTGLEEPPAVAEPRATPPNPPQD